MIVIVTMIMITIILKPMGAHFSRCYVHRFSIVFSRYHSQPVREQIYRFLLLILRDTEMN